MHLGCTYVAFSNPEADPSQSTQDPFGHHPDFRSTLSHDLYWLPRADEERSCPKLAMYSSADEDTDYSQCSPIHYYGTLETFLSTLWVPDFCGNLLDIHSQDMQRPWFIR